MNTTLGDSRSMTLPATPGPELKAHCPSITVQFVDFSLSSVWQIRHGTIDRREPFGDTEFVSASVTSVDTGGSDIGGEDIVFSYLPTPYNSVPHVAIDLAANIGNVRKLILGTLAALVVTGWQTLSAAVGSVAVNWIRQSLSKRLKRRHPDVPHRRLRIPGHRVGTPAQPRPVPPRRPRGRSQRR